MTPMATEIYLASGTIAIIVAVLLIEEGISFIIRRAAKAAKIRPVITRDLVTGLRIVALVIIISAVLSFTGLASEFTSLTISGIAALVASLALQSSLSNVIAGIFLINDGVVRIDDEIEYSGVKGKVVRIALRNIWIKTESGAIAVVSNSSLSSGPLVNHTAIERLSKKLGIHQG
jgi:small conductance mechanosensitive channel